jgi:hypothetical protein
MILMLWVFGLCAGCLDTDQKKNTPSIMLLGYLFFSSSGWQIQMEISPVLSDKIMLRPSFILLSCFISTDPRRLSMSTKAGCLLLSPFIWIRAEGQ